MTSLAKIKKGDKVVILGFTGIMLSITEVIEATSNTLTVLKKDGSEMIFDKTTRLQTNSNNPKYANKVVHIDDTPEQKSKIQPKKESKEKSKKNNKIEKIVEIIEENDEDFYEEV
jgi:hypothetical protein